MDSPGFAQWIKERRKSLDITQATLGHLTGCSESSIRKIEAGTLKPSRQVADLLASSLQVPEEEHSAFVQWARSGPDAQPPPELQAARTKLPIRKSASSALPIPPTALIGRENEVAEVLTLLGREGVRLLTLIGPPGMGKTRLALKVAADAEEQFRDGVLFVPLAHISDPKLVISTISRASGVGEARGRSAVQALSEHLHDRNMLVVLDNFEQVIDAAPDIAELLAGVPDCVFLATSREALHLRGEQVYPVPPLALPTAPADAEQVAEVPSVSLFVQRAQETDPAFSLNSSNAEDVAAICLKLEGLPLAIELAAARIAIFPPDALLARLDRRLSVLTDGARDLPPRQRTIRASVASSYDLLDPHEQRLFRLVSVFSGGWTLEAADGVVATEDGRWTTDERQTVQLMDSLRAKSLVRQDAHAGEPRFTMLEMIREYAAEKLQEQEEESVARRDHARYFMRVAEEAEPLIMGGKQAGTLDMLEREHPNLRAALTWAHSANSIDGEGVDVAARICAALSRFWLRRGHWTEGRRWIEDTLALLEREDGEQLEEERARTRREKHARLLHMSGAIAYRQGDYQLSNVRLRQSTELWREIADRPQSLAEVLQDMGTLAVLRDEYGKATEALTEALEIHRAAENKQGSAQILTLLGFEATALGNYDRARALLSEALDLFREMGDRWGMLRVQQHIAVVARDTGDFTLAQRLLDENLAVGRELDNKSAIAASLGEMGMLALAQGDHMRADKLTQEVLEIYGELGGRGAGAVAILILGLTALYRGDYAEAEAACLEALQIFHHEEARYNTASSLMALAGVAAARGQARRSAQLMGASEAIFDSLGARMDYFSRILQSQLAARLQAQLGESALTAAREKGAAMSLDEAAAYAENPPKAQEQYSNGAQAVAQARR